jgi:fucose 4-O-acetylase-like acetyltransferase
MIQAKTLPVSPAPYREYYRVYYIDRLHVLLTATVLLFHAAITYGGSGSWFYREVPVSGRPTSLLLTLFNLTLQSFFMGFFFLLAGYFTPGAYDRKGLWKFLQDRFLRLGVPFLFFCFVLGPFTSAMSDAAQGGSFRTTLHKLWQQHRIINGPLWFAEALLIFSIAYCLWRSLSRRILNPLQQPSSRPSAQPPIPPPRTWLLSALCVGLASLLIRQIFALDYRLFGVWPAYFASYIFLFSLGVIAFRLDWLARFTWPQARLSVIAACVAWPALPVALVMFNAGSRHPATISGLSWPNVIYALWEPLIAWGIIAALLLWFRTHLNQPSVLWDWLSRRTYAVYILHTPILVALSLLLRTWHAPAIVKFGVAGTLTCAATWLAADPLVRLPGLRRIV